MESPLLDDHGDSEVDYDTEDYPHSGRGGLFYSQASKGALTGGLAASVLCDLDLGAHGKFLRALSPQAERGDFVRWDRVRAEGGDGGALWRRFCGEPT